jgi:hypothetical protein
LSAGQGIEPGPYALIDSVSGTAYADAPAKTAKTFYSYSILPARGVSRGVMSSPACSNRPVPMGLLVTLFSRTRVGLKWVADTVSDYNVYRKYGAIPDRHELEKLHTSPVCPKPVMISYGDGRGGIQTTKARNSWNAPALAIYDIRGRMVKHIADIKPGMFT